MKLNSFIKKLSLDEAGLSQAKVGDIRQLLRIVNEKVNGELYKQIKSLPEPDADNLQTT